MPDKKSSDRKDTGSKEAGSKHGAGPSLHGGPGASQEDARERPPAADRTAKNPAKRKSDVSGGGGERDSHHTHDPARKGDRNK